MLLWFQLFSIFGLNNFLTLYYLKLNKHSMSSIIEGEEKSKGIEIVSEGSCMKCTYFHSGLYELRRKFLVSMHCVIISDLSFRRFSGLEMLTFLPGKDCRYHYDCCKFFSFNFTVYNQMFAIFFF